VEPMRHPAVAATCDDGEPRASRPGGRGRARSLALALVLLLAAAVRPGLGQEAGDAPLRVGLDPRSPPWAFVPGADYSSVDFHREPVLGAGELRQLAGLDVDVSRALARELGRPLVLRPVGYYQLEDALLSGRIDLIVNAWTRTRDTPASIRGSDPYYTWGLLIAARADDSRVSTLSDLRGLRVGHFASSLVNQTLHSLGAGELRTYDNEDRLFGDLEAGELDAVVYDSPAVRWHVKQDPSLRAVGQPLNKLGYHVALRREDEALFARVQAAIAALAGEGELERIRRRWEDPE
jgi:ABC-type amino acid transport substrate-binding protein